MQEVYSLNLPLVTEICDKFQARHDRKILLVFTEF